MTAAACAAGSGSDTDRLVARLVNLHNAVARRDAVGIVRGRGRRLADALTAAGHPDEAFRLRTAVDRPRRFVTHRRLLHELLGIARDVEAAGQ